MCCVLLPGAVPWTLVVREGPRSSRMVLHFLKRQEACQGEKADGRIYGDSGNVKHGSFGLRILPKCYS